MGRKPALQNKVLVLDKKHRPLDPTTPARARRLLKAGRAVVHRVRPFVIRLKDRVLEDSVTHPHVLGVDPGSRSTGLAIARQVESVDTETGEVSEHRDPVLLGQIDHRGQAVRKKMTQRSMYRRGRRSRNLRYRKPRFDNRHSKRELAPSLQSRVDNITSWADRYSRWVPQLSLVVETARFDTQKMDNPEISGVEYQQGELAGFEVREYVLFRDGHACVYCDAIGVPLNLDHVRPKSRGGSNRVSNLVASCIPCNEAKDAMSVEEFVTDPKRLARIKSRMKRGLADTAWMNATRYSLVPQLRRRGHEVATSTGAKTKFTRTRLSVPKSHALDALCVGMPDSVGVWPEQVLMATATGRGSYARTTPDRHGFPRLRRPEAKKHFGFTTGDLVQAVVPTGKKAGTYVGRVAVRKSGRFNITTSTDTVQGINHKHVRLVQPADGYNYHQKEGSAIPPGPEGPGFLARTR